MIEGNHVGCSDLPLLSYKEPFPQNIFKVNGLVGLFGNIKDSLVAGSKGQFHDSFDFWLFVKNSAYVPD
jgi:hypothetical protein